MPTFRTVPEPYGADRLDPDRFYAVGGPLSTEMVVRDNATREEWAEGLDTKRVTPRLVILVLLFILVLLCVLLAKPADELGIRPGALVLDSSGPSAGGAELACRPVLKPSA